MRLTHPDLGATIVESDDVDYIGLLRQRGWAEAPVLPDLPDLAAATVKEILAQVGDDPELAAAALEQERAGKARKGLLTQLEEIAAAGGAVVPPADVTPAPEPAPNEFGTPPLEQPNPDPGDTSSARTNTDEEPSA